MKRLLRDAQAMQVAGRELSRSAGQPGVIYLEGELGSGKTTLVRSLLFGLGYTGKVKSPTYTLVETYALDPLTVYHLDLYRLADPEELEWLGIRDLHHDAALLLVEWPTYGAGLLPSADLVICLEYHGDGRLLQLRALTPRGELMAAGLDEKKRIISS